MDHMVTHLTHPPPSATHPPVLLSPVLDGGSGLGLLGGPCHLLPCVPSPCLPVLLVVQRWVCVPLGPLGLSEGL